LSRITVEHVLTHWQARGAWRRRPGALPVGSGGAIDLEYREVVGPKDEVLWIVLFQYGGRRLQLIEALVSTSVGNQGTRGSTTVGLPRPETVTQLLIPRLLQTSAPLELQSHPRRAGIWGIKLSHVQTGSVYNTTVVCSESESLVFDLVSLKGTHWRRFYTDVSS